MGLVKSLLFDRDELSNLPAHAWDNTFDVDGPFNPDMAWLRTAEADQQRIAIHGWFVARYCDPAQETPYNSEQGYTFINGGPYDPREVLEQQFAGVVDDELIAAVADDLVGEVGEQWAPIRPHRPDDFDERYDLFLTEQNEPLARLEQRLVEGLELLDLQGTDAQMQQLRRLVFSSGVAALEAFLYETASYWVENDEDVVKALITQMQFFRDQPLKLGDIYDHHAALKEKVKGQFQSMVWHRWDTVAQIYAKGLKTRLPGLAQFDDALLKRHDIVHRSGLSKDGTPVIAERDEIEALFQAIRTFGKTTERRVVLRNFAIGGDNK